MDIGIVITQMVELFIMLGAGFVLVRTKVLQEDFIAGLNAFVLNITMPLLIIGSVETEIPDSMPLTDVLLMTALLVFGLPFIAFVVLKVLPIKKARGLVQFIIMYPNIGFMGFPLMRAIYGDIAVLYTAIVNMIFNVSLFIAGDAIMAERKGFSFDPKQLFTPGMVASVLAVFLYAFRIMFPEWILVPLNSFGDMTTPLAMLIIGATLAGYRLKDVFGNVKIYLLVFFTGVIIPLLYIPIMKALIHDPMVCGIGIIIAAMPAANATVLFARKYHQPELLASSAVCVSTLLSIVTIPFVIMVAGL